MKRKFILIIVCLVLVISLSFWKIQELNASKTGVDVSQNQIGTEEVRNEQDNIPEEGISLPKIEDKKTSTPIESAKLTLTQESKAEPPSPPSQPPYPISSPSSDRLIKVGDSSEVVISIMGYPNSIERSYNLLTGKAYIYKISGTRSARDFEFSELYLAPDGNMLKVVGWNNNAGNLKITSGEKIPSAPPITLGSSKEDVVKAMGTPVLLDSVDRSWLYTGGSWVKFDTSNKVISWTHKGYLKVSMGEKVASAPPINFDSTVQDVVKAMGTPTSIMTDPLTEHPRSMIYDDSFVVLGNNDRVVSWTNKGNLKVSLGTKDASAPLINFDSTVQDVVKAMGTPISISTNSGDRLWSMAYKNSSVYFDDNGKVSAWLNNGDLKVSLGEKDLNSPGIKIGSSMEETVKAMGTPQQVQGKTAWSYGNSMIFFDDQFKIERIDNKGNIKIDNSSKVMNP